MQPRLAALLFALGLVDLAYVNLGLGQEVFAEPAAAELEVAPTPPSAQSDEPPPPPESPPAPAVLPPRIEPSPNIEPASSGAAPATHVTPLASAHTGAASAPVVAEQPAAAAPSSEAPPSERQTNDAERAAASDLMVGFPDKASWFLTARAREELLALAAQLREHPEYRVRIVGHADARGSREFNRDLGSRRARAVSEVLARAGVPRDQIEAETRGEDQPRAVGATERVWAANRRVEISVGSARSETP